MTLRRRYCLFTMEAGRRCGHIPGITANPGRPATVQQIRNLLMDLGDRAAGFRFLIHDRARPFTGAFEAALAGAGTGAVTIRPRSPRANAYPERFVLTARTEVTDQMLIFGPRHLRSILPGTRPAATGGGPIAAASPTRPGPATLSPASPSSG